MLGAVEVTSVVEVTGFLTILSLVTWLVRRVFTHTIPRLATDFRDGLGKQQDLFSSALKEQQITFQDALRLQREDFKEALKEERTDFKDTLREERDHMGKRLDRLTDAVERLAQSRVRENDNGS